MSNCSSPGDSLNKWIDGCEHLAAATGDTKVTTIKVGSNPSVSTVNTTLTSKGLGVPPTEDNDPKLNSWSPVPNSTLRPVEESDFENPPGLDNDPVLNSWSPVPNSTLMPVEESDFENPPGLPTDLPKTGSNTSNPPQSLDPSQTTPKQSSPSQRPYVWKPYP